MDYSQPHLSEDMHIEMRQLSEQLKLRNQLVEQLSTELYRMIKAHPAALPPAHQSSAPQNPAHQNSAPQNPAITPTSLPIPRATASEPDLLKQEMTTLESQLEFYQNQIDKRDAQIAHLQGSCQSLSERNQALERIIQELPEVYHQKFAHRLDRVKSKVKFLQIENQKLYSALQHSGDQLSDSGRPIPTQKPLFSEERAT